MPENTSTEPSEREPNAILLPGTYDAMAEALSFKLHYPLYLMTDSDRVLTQQEVLAAWLMDEPSIGGSRNDINYKVLAINAKLGGEKRAAADEILKTIEFIQVDAIEQSLKTGVDPVIEDAHFWLRVRRFEEGSAERLELDRLNAAKSLYKLATETN